MGVQRSIWGKGEILCGVTSKAAHKESCSEASPQEKPNEFKAHIRHSKDNGSRGTGKAQSQHFMAKTGEAVSLFKPF